MQLEKRGRGRPATGLNSTMMRVPNALKPAVAELVAHYRQAKVKAWEAAPLKQPDTGATGNRDSAACHETIGNRDHLACHETTGGNRDRVACHETGGCDDG